MMDSDGENIIADPLTVIGQSSEKLTEKSCYAPLLADRWLRSEVMSVVFTVLTLRYSHKPALKRRVRHVETRSGAAFVSKQLLCA